MQYHYYTIEPESGEARKQADNVDHGWERVGVMSVSFVIRLDG